MNHYSTFWYFRFIKKISIFCLDKGAIISNGKNYIEETSKVNKLEKLKYDILGKKIELALPDVPFTTDQKKVITDFLLSAKKE